MERDYDIIIIGTGTAGRTFANKVASSGLKIAIIDMKEYGVSLLPAAVILKRCLQILQRSRTGIIDL
jgi:pyruvate/2-oxoglutarate dehydrogenase complex dihydrolipoamide dehydrogenase (E3) component